MLDRDLHSAATLSAPFNSSCDWGLPFGHSRRAELRYTKRKGRKAQRDCHKRDERNPLLDLTANCAPSVCSRFTSNIEGDGGDSRLQFYF
jgi:hypothetical protein